MKKITPTMALMMSIFDLWKRFEWSKQVLGMMVDLCRSSGKDPKKIRECYACVDMDECWGSTPLSKAARIRKRDKRDFCFAKKITLNDVIKALESEYAKNRSWRYWSNNRTVLQRICSIGFTRIDSVALPQNTVSINDLKKLSKDKLLSLDARVLGTIKDAPRRCSGLEDEWEERGKTSATVEDILNNKFDILFHTEEARVRMQKVLAQLGFSYEDGPFMRFLDKRQQLVDDLMDTEVIEQGIASLIVQIAEKRGWIKL